MNRFFELDGISFPDESAIEMTIDRDARRLKLKMSGAWNGKQVGPGYLVLHGWDDLVHRRYDSSASTWAEIPPGEEVNLKDICEIEINASEIILRGFGASSGQWIELVAYNAQGQYVVEG